MPNRQYVPSGGRWPRWADHLLSHIHEVGIAAIGVLFGVFLVTPYLDMVTTTTHEILLGIALIIGGLLNIFATTSDFKTRATYWLWKRTGIVLTMTAWLTFAVTLYILTGRFRVAVYMTGAVGVLSLCSLVRTLLDEHRIEAAREQYGADMPVPVVTTSKETP